MRPAEITPVVLRFQNGRRTSGKLQCVSLTSGLLALSELLGQGSIVKLIGYIRSFDTGSDLPD